MFLCVSVVLLSFRYAAELLKYGIVVDHFGRCGAPDPCLKGPGHFKFERNGSCFYEFARKYKFYLSFENSVCQDYITGNRFQFSNIDGLSLECPILVSNGQKHVKNMNMKETMAPPCHFFS